MHISRIKTTNDRWTYFKIIYNNNMEFQKLINSLEIIANQTPEYRTNTSVEINETESL